MRRVHLKITGRVQGVFFRAHTQKTAEELSLTGWVRNNEDGGVETVAEGEKSALERFVAWCNNGPPSAHVTRVDENWEEAKGEFKDFGIRY
ncbi:MAG: acylphosphatase [Deltaproteobacteria bacterium CG11_big_fil_rev_8_21_14_0_20_49_13]|nr:MAG: acylphosphatase [Deltaproteobacteria bacterium CG11_big_fil_rev_8_21_14_0_20_49_13]